MPKYARKRKATSAPKRRYYAKKKAPAYRAKTTTTRRRRNSRGLRSGSYAKHMQDQTFQYVKKKYTFVEPIIVGVGDDSA